jgi:peptide deformylase
MNKEDQYDIITPKKIEGKLSELFNISDLQEDDLKELKVIGNEMIQFCIDRKGAGLSGCQVGFFRSMFVWNTRNGWEIIINPKYFKSDRKKITTVEKCLSYPNKSFRVDRFKKIWANYYVFKGDNLIKKSRYMVGYEALVFQHEADHTFGKTIKMIGDLNPE